MKVFVNGMPSVSTSCIVVLVYCVAVEKCDEMTLNSVSSYLGIADLQSSGVQLGDARVMGGHKHPVLLPEHRWNRSSSCYAIQQHHPIYNYGLVLWTLPNHWRGPI